MKNKELNALMGFNLRKLRVESKLTQEQLADLILVNTRLFQKWEAGVKGIGKDVLLKLCKIFKVKPYAFYIDSKAPYLANSREREIVLKHREAEKLGVAEMIEQFSDFVITQAKKKQRESNDNHLSQQDK